MPWCSRYADASPYVVADRVEHGEDGGGVAAGPGVVGGDLVGTDADRAERERDVHAGAVLPGQAVHHHRAGSSS